MKTFVPLLHRLTHALTSAAHAAAKLLPGGWVLAQVLHSSPCEVHEFARDGVAAATTMNPTAIDFSTAFIVCVLSRPV